MGLEQIQNYIYEKRLTQNDIVKSTEVEEKNVNLNWQNVGDLKIFLGGIEPNYPTPLTGITQNVWSRGNTSLTAISYTGLHQSVRGFYYQNADYGAPSVVEMEGVTSSVFRCITVPMQYVGDRIKPETFTFSLSTSDLYFEKFLSLRNSIGYNQTYNSAFAILADEVYVNPDEIKIKCDEKFDSFSNNFGFEIAFRLRNDINSSGTGVDQVIYYRPRITPKESFTGSSSSFAYSTSSIPSNYSYQDLNNQRFSSQVSRPSVSGNLGDAAFAITYNRSGTSCSFALFVDGVRTAIFPSITSVITSNALTSSPASSTTWGYYDLLDDKWHHLIVNWAENNGTNPGWENGRMYLDGTRLEATKRATNLPSYPNVKASYDIDGETIDVPTPIYIGARVLPIDEQVTNRNLRIIQSKAYASASGDILQSILDYDKPIEYENANYKYLYDFDSQENTGLYSYFGSLNLEKYLNSYINQIQTTDIAPINREKNKYDIKKETTFNNVTKCGINGFNADIAFVNVWADCIQDAFQSSVQIGERMNVKLTGISSYDDLLIKYRFLDPKMNIGHACLTGQYYYNADILPILQGPKNVIIYNFEFYKENFDSVVIKNRSQILNPDNYSVEYSNKNINYNYSGACILISSEDFKNTLKGAYAKISNDYRIYDKAVKTFPNNGLSHGILKYRNLSTNTETNIGVIYYDLGIIFMTNNFVWPGAVNQDIVNSLTAGVKLVFGINPIFAPIIDPIIVENLSFISQKFKYSTYIDINLDLNEYNISQNDSALPTRNVSYPTTIGFFNDKDECLASSKISYITKKNDTYKIKYKTKLQF